MLQLADNLNRLGTENAFEILARAAELGIRHYAFLETLDRAVAVPGCLNDSHTSNILADKSTHGS